MITIVRNGSALRKMKAKAAKNASKKLTKKAKYTEQKHKINIKRFEAKRHPLYGTLGGKKREEFSKQKIAHTVIFQRIYCA